MNKFQHAYNKRKIEHCQKILHELRMILNPAVALNASATLNNLQGSNLILDSLRLDVAAREISILIEHYGSTYEVCTKRIGAGRHEHLWFYDMSMERGYRLQQLLEIDNESVAKTIKGEI